MARRMKNRKSQRSEKPEVKVDAADVERAFELVMGLVRKACDQHNAERNSTASSSSKSKELPHMETGKELAVRHVNPSPYGQHGGEHVNGDAGIEKQTGKGSEELMALAIGDRQGARKLNPLPTEGSESDSDLPTMIHPSAAPQGSLLHALYLQLLSSGTNGITKQELFKCLEKSAEVLDFAGDWKVQVRWHLKVNTHFGEAKGFHFLVCNDQQEVQQLKRRPANIGSTSRRPGASSSQIVLSNLHPDPAPVQTGLSVDTHHGAHDLPTMIHPSAAPEGSLLHALYLQLLGSDTNGITVRELFECLKKPAEMLNFACDWKKQVRRHLKTNTHFGEVKGHHFLVWNDQQEVQQPTQSPANNASTPRRHGESSSQAVLPNLHPDPATVQTGLSVDTHRGVVQTRRKAFQKAIASISYQAKEFEEVHQSTADMEIMPFPVADPTDPQLVSHRRVRSPSRKRKSFSSRDEEVPEHGHPIVHAIEAKTSAEVEVQTGQLCTVLKNDDTGNWRSNNMAKAGHTLCDDHMSLQVQGGGPASLSPNAGSPLITSEAGIQTRVLCSHRHKSTRLPCNTLAMNDHKLCELHKEQWERRKARRDARREARRERTDAQPGKQDATPLQHNQDSSILGLPVSHPNLDQAPPSLHTKSVTISPRVSREAVKTVAKPATEVPHLVDDPNGDRSQQQMPEIKPKRQYVAARKTAANVGPSRLKRAPTIPPLPPTHGFRRKTPTGEVKRSVKNRIQ